MEAAAIGGDPSPLGDPGSSRGDSSGIQKMENPGDEDLCGICEAIVVERGVLDCCDHRFCFSCIEDWATVTNLCPMCKAQFKFLTLVTTTGETIPGNSENNAKSVSEEAFSYFIDEEAIACLDGDDCKLRMQALQTALVDTSVACDKCDRWYHACCVGFDPAKPSAKTWICPRCTLPDADAEKTDRAKIKTEAEAASASFAFMESGESAIVISMVGGKESNIQENAIASSSSIPEHREQTSLDKLFESLGKQNASPKGDDADEDEQEIEELEEEQLVDDPAGDLGSFGEEQRLEDFGFDEQVLDFDADKEELDPDAETAEERDEEPSEDAQPEPIKRDDELEPEIDKGDDELEPEIEPLEQEIEPEPIVETVEAIDEVKIEELVSDDDRELKLKPSIDDLPKKNESEPKLVRTRIIMRRDTDDLSLAEKIRQQVAAAAADGKQPSNETLLAAYKAAIVKRDGSKQKRSIDTGRENLKRKLYGGIRGRRVYDRDWDVSFWRDKVLRDKRRKPDEQEALTAETTELTSQRPESIFDRVCVADCSLLPRKEGYKPAPVTEDKPRPKPPFRSVPKTLETKQGLAADQNVVKDKKQWAIELLARKNKQQVRSSDSTLKGNFVHLQKLPIDMRPTIEPNPRSKIPSAVRQIQLNRLTEHYLKNMNIEVGRNDASSEAVNSALKKEAEIFLRSNSKIVYVNLCVRALARGDDPPKINAEPSKNAVAQALLATGLISESPPGSPEAGSEPAAAESTSIAAEDPKLDQSLEQPELVVNPGSGKQGITALLEHLMKEEQPEVVPASEQDPISAPSDSKQEQADGKDLETDANAADASVQRKDEDPAPVAAESKTENEDEKMKISEVSGSEKTTENNPDAEKDENKQREEDREPVDASRCEKAQEKGSKTHPDRRIDRSSSRKHQRDSRPDKHQDPRKKREKIAPDDAPGGDKLSELDLRINRVRSSVAQQFGKDSDIAQQIRETSRAVEREAAASKSRKPSSADHPRKQQQKSLSVQEKVEMYVKEHIRPLFKSGVIKAEQYQWTVTKTTAKVMQHHKDASSAEFLISEGGRVKKLAEQYLQRFAQEKKESIN